MTIADKEALVRRYWEDAWSNGDLEAVDEVYAPTFLHDDGKPFTPDKFKKRIVSTRTSVPDLKISIDELFGAGENIVVSRVTYTGTMLGPMGDLAPTGKTMKFTGIDIFHFRDGKVTEHWHQADHLAMMEQLGLLPE